MNSRKAAKKLIKRAKKQPNLYSAQEVLYAKLYRKHESKFSDSNAKGRGNHGLHSKSEQPTESNQPSSSWFTRLLCQARSLVSFRASTYDSRDRDNESNSSTDIKT